MERASVQKNETDQFERQVRKLYSRSLFLRKDEQKSLRDSAKLLDKQAAILSLLNLLSGTEGSDSQRCDISPFLAELRKWHSMRKSDSEYLARIRTEAIAFRKAQMKKNGFSKWMTHLAGGSFSNQLRPLEDTLLQANINNAELERKVALKLCIMMVAISFQRKKLSVGSEPFSKITNVLGYVGRLRWKRELYTKLFKAAKYKAVREGSRTP